MYKIKYSFFDGKSEPDTKTGFIDDKEVNMFITSLRNKGFVGSMNKKGGSFTAKVEPGHYDHHGREYYHHVSIRRYREPRPMNEGEIAAFVPTIKSKFTVQLEPGSYSLE